MVLQLHCSSVVVRGSVLKSCCSIVAVVLQRVVVCQCRWRLSLLCPTLHNCSVLQCVTAVFSVLQCVAVCCDMLQCVAVVLQVVILPHIAK